VNLIILTTVTNPPSMKVAMTAILSVVLICIRHTSRVGSMRMTISKKMVVEVWPRHTSSKFIQFPPKPKGNIHASDIGVHRNIRINSTMTAHIVMSAPIANALFLSQSTIGNNRTKKVRMESLKNTKHGLYRGSSR
jgi:hypothetical protein